MLNLNQLPNFKAYNILKILILEIFSLSLSQKGFVSVLTFFPPTRLNYQTVFQNQEFSWAPLSFCSSVSQQSCCFSSVHNKKILQLVMAYLSWVLISEASARRCLIILSLPQNPCHGRFWQGAKYGTGVNLPSVLSLQYWDSVTRN